MATRRKDSDTQQLDFFAAPGKSYETIDPIRTDGRETLARTLPETGSRPESERTIAPDAPRSGGEDQGRNSHVAAGTDKTGQNRGASPPPSLGNGAGEIHFTSARRLAVDDAAVSHQDAGKIKNLNNYRITDADRIGEGSLKQKFSQNLDAIRTLRQIEAERRPATLDEKAVLVKYVGWGSLPAAFAKLPEGEPSTQLAELLTAEELKSARATTLNAHYTSPLIIRAISPAQEE